jgi:hypothetical protein
MLKLAEVSDRAIWEEYGRSHENRPLGNLIVSSPENIARIEEIREKHIMLSDPGKSAGMDISQMPVVIKLGYGVHGNESSAQNAAMLAAYYLTAGVGDKIDELLKNAVILIDPSLNPDGLQRHSTWVNMYKSNNLNPDETSIEFNEAWPGGRTNHYWFDLNRDYIMLQHPETIGRVAAFHKWKPNINTDHHEMGASSTFFFQPGVRTRENPLTPEENYELVTEISQYHIKYLDNVGSLYYSEEGFDDYYLGKGSAYPDIHASVGILFEQAGVKGHLRETSSGIVSFPFAIRNQFTVTLSSLEAGLKMREKLLAHQVSFYNDALALADKDAVKGYLFSEPSDNARTARFIENLMMHQIKVYRLGHDYSVDGKSYKAENSYYVPLRQNEYRYIKSMFETVTSFKDETFYDISTWTLPLSFDIPYSAVRSTKGAALQLGPELAAVPFADGKLLADREAYAYLFEWKEYYTPKALYALLDAGLKVRVATEGFTYSDGSLQKEFSNGTIMVPAYGQELDRDAIYKLMQKISMESMITIYGAKTGHTVKGIDLGSNSFVTLNKPGILMFVGGGIRSGDAGEIWHMLDQKFDIPVTMVDPASTRSIDFSRYNVIILAGSPDLSESMISDLNSWNRNGGTVVAYKGGNSFIAGNRFADIKSVPSAGADPDVEYRYSDMSSLFSKHRIPGSIFQVEIDITHPLCYGYERNTLPVLKGDAGAYLPTGNPFANPARFSDKPLISGFSSPENLERVAGTSFASVHSNGGGKIISIYDNTNFRAIWFGTSKIFMNALFFGEVMR